MEKLVESMVPDASVTTDLDMASGVSASPSMSAPGAIRQPVNVPNGSLSPAIPAGLLAGVHSRGSASQSSPAMLTPESAQAANMESERVPAQGYERVCRTLQGLFPDQQDMNTIVRESPGVLFVTSLFYSNKDITEGNSEPLSHLTLIPPVSSHPTVLARRLLQVSICMQQLPPAFDTANLVMKSTIAQTMANIVSTVIDLVTSNDEVIGTAEGLECLILQGVWQANAGNLRKAWLSYRRALSLGQLMGIDRAGSHALKSADPRSNSKLQPSPESLWYRIIFCDRYFSLVLGLPIGAQDNSFASDEATARDTPAEKLEKFHTVIAGRIIDRNSNKTPQAYATTQIIDCDLEAAAQNMARQWWAEPILSPFATPAQIAQSTSHLNLQIHHFSLLVLLHLPYLLRDPSESRYDYSKATCVRSSREVLKRFISFRSLISSAFACRHIDYAALMAAMTLLLSYLSPKPGTSANPQPLATCGQREEDRKLVEVVRERMEHVAIVNHDRLSRESADMVGQLMVILEAQSAGHGHSVSECGSAALERLHLAIPYLGTISIHPNSSAMAAAPFAEGLTVGGAAHLLCANSSANGLQHAPDAPLKPLATGGIEQAMDFNTTIEEPQFSPGDYVANGMYMEFEPQDENLLFPDLMAEGDDWAFQGVDTTYWSLLNGGMGSG